MGLDQRRQPLRFAAVGADDEAAVVGRPDAKSGEAVKAFVIASDKSLTPEAIVARLNRAAVAALAVPSVATRLGDLGITPVGSAPDASRAFVASETERWGKVAREAGIRIE